MKQLSAARFFAEKVHGPLARIIVEDDVTEADLMAPEFWSHIASRLRRFQRVEVLNECGRWLSEVCVADCGRVWARVVVMWTVSLEGASSDEADPRSAYKIEYRAPDHYRIKRISDGAVVEKGFTTKRDAEVRLDSYLKALAA